MLTHAQEVTALTRGKTRADVDSDRLLNLALVRLLQIIGEAANRIPIREQERHLQIPWALIVGLRNRLIHEYDSVDFDILGQIVTYDIPSPIAVLETVEP